MPNRVAPPRSGDGKAAAPTASQGRGFIPKSIGVRGGSGEASSPGIMLGGGGSEAAHRLFFSFCLLSLIFWKESLACSSPGPGLKETGNSSLFHWLNSELNHFREAVWNGEGEKGYESRTLEVDGGGFGRCEEQI